MVKFMKKIGLIENYFSKVSVAVLQLTEDGITKGDKIHIKGSTTDFEMLVESMQIDRKEIESADKGQKIGLMVPERVREKDEVFKSV
jgi:putative protease